MPRSLAEDRELSRRIQIIQEDLDYVLAPRLAARFYDCDLEDAEVLDEIADFVKEFLFERRDITGLSVFVSPLRQDVRRAASSVKITVLPSIPHN